MDLFIEVLIDLVGFAAKGLVVFLVAAAIIVVIVAMSRKDHEHEATLKIKPLNDRLRRMADIVRANTLKPKVYKKLIKARAKEEKKQDKPQKKIYVLSFKGDMLASAVANLREEITALVNVVQEGDEILLRLESPGGVVHGYGLAASQLERLKQRDIRLVVCIDKIAASGGYMMAAVADEIIAAPFAIVGSIGVAAPVPNAHRLLKQYGVDYEEFTAGEYKRTVSTFGEITRKGRQKFQQQIEDTHGLFKDHVRLHRDGLDVDTVSTGEHWYGAQALRLGLVNRLMTSDDYLLSNVDEAQLFEVTYQRPKTMRDKLMTGLGDSVERVLMRAWSRLEELRFG